MAKHPLNHFPLLTLQENPSSKNRQTITPTSPSFAALVRMSGILALPEGCIANVISFTTPSDACRLACVSTTFRSAADSDVVWDRFLPSDYLSAISDSASSPTSSLLSKKELYLRACHNPLLINEGKLVISRNHDI